MLIKTIKIFRSVPKNGFYNNEFFEIDFTDAIIESNKLRNLKREKLVGNDNGFCFLKNKRNDIITYRLKKSEINDLYEIEFSLDKEYDNAFIYKNFTKKDDLKFYLENLFHFPLSKEEIDISKINKVKTNYYKKTDNKLVVELTNKIFDKSIYKKLDDIISNERQNINSIRALESKKFNLEKEINALNLEYKEEIDRLNKKFNEKEEKIRWECEQKIDRLNKEFDEKEEIIRWECNQKRYEELIMDINKYNYISNYDYNDYRIGKQYFINYEEYYSKANELLFNKIFVNINKEINALIVGGGNGLDLITLNKICKEKNLTLNCAILDKVIWPYNKIKQENICNIKSLKLMLDDYMNYFEEDDAKNFDIIIFSRCVNFVEIENFPVETLKELNHYLKKLNNRIYFIESFNLNKNNNPNCYSTKVRQWFEQVFSIEMFSTYDNHFRHYLYELK